MIISWMPYATIPRSLVGSVVSKMSAWVGDAEGSGGGTGALGG